MLTDVFSAYLEKQTLFRSCFFLTLRKDEPKRNRIPFKQSYFSTEDYILSQTKLKIFLGTGSSPRRT